MLRICISGLSCSGKTTLGDALAKDLRIMHITKHGLESYEKPKKDGAFAIHQMADRKFAESFDKEVLALAKINDCVLTTWLGPWMVKDATTRIWLNAPFDTRAERYAQGKGVGMGDAKAFIKKKDELSIEGFKEVYNIDVLDHAFFDMMLNTDRLSIKEEVSIISMLVLGKAESRFR